MLPKHFQDMSLPSAQNFLSNSVFAKKGKTFPGSHFRD